MTVVKPAWDLAEYDQVDVDHTPALWGLGLPSRIHVHAIRILGGRLMIQPGPRAGWIPLQRDDAVTVLEPQP